MDFNRIVNMIINQLVRRGTNWGINKGIDMATGNSKKPRSEMTPEERALDKKGRETADLARKTAKITRKLGR